MSRTTLIAVGLRLLIPIAALAILFVASAPQPASDPNPKRENAGGDGLPPDRNGVDGAQNAPSDAIAHGKYIVHHVAMCIVCHTPKTNDGRLIKSKLLTGAFIPVESPYPGQKWALKAPHLAGLPGGWSEDALSEFLQTGKTPTDYGVQLPMPPFRMNERDANAVAAYLRSLATR